MFFFVLATFSGEFEELFEEKPGEPSEAIDTSARVTVRASVEAD